MGHSKSWFLYCCSKKLESFQFKLTGGKKSNMYFVKIKILFPLFQTCSRVQKTDCTLIQISWVSKQQAMITLQEMAVLNSLYGSFVA